MHIAYVHLDNTLVDVEEVPYSYVGLVQFWLLGLDSPFSLNMRFWAKIRKTTNTLYMFQRGGLFSVGRKHRTNLIFLIFFNIYNICYTICFFTIL
jgi:hypothetical protein